MSEKGNTGDTGATGAVGAAGAEGAVGRQGLQGEAGPAAMLDPATAKQIKDTLRILVIATVALYLIMLAGGTFVFFDSRGSSSDNEDRIADNRKLALEGQEAHDALCTFRTDLQRRITLGRQFLATHPEGIPGISAADLARSIAGQESTLKALKISNCKEAP